MLLLSVAIFSRSINHVHHVVTYDKYTDWAKKTDTSVVLHERLSNYKL